MSDVQDVVILGPTRPLLLRLHVTIDEQSFRQVWQARFDELFDNEDRKRTGRITVEQGDAIARDMNGGLRDTPRSVAKDSQLRSVADEQGTVDRAVLLAYVKKLLPPFVMISRGVVAQGAAQALFPLLDTNHDLLLSEAELAAAESQLRQRDFNDDGVITGFELIFDPKAIAAATDDEGTERRRSAARAGVPRRRRDHARWSRAKTAGSLRSRQRWQAAQRQPMASCNCRSRSWPGWTPTATAC